MKKLMKIIEEKAEKLSHQIDESEFIRKGNKMSWGKIGFKLEDGMYVVYKDGDVVGTFQDFVPALQSFKFLTRD